MKKIVYSLLLLILAVGVSGCTKQPTENENETKEKAMLSYLNKKYDRQFTSVLYLPAKRGFNDGMNENILVAQTDDGIRVDVRERAGDAGSFSDNYLAAYGSKLFKRKMDYRKIQNLQSAKPYVYLRPDQVSIEDMKKESFTFTNSMVIHLSSIISISGRANEGILRELYDVYQQMQSFGFDKTIFVAAFGGDSAKTEKYVNNYYIYGSQSWEDYDSSVKQVMNITEKGLSFEQFKNKLKNTVN